MEGIKLEEDKNQSNNKTFENNLSNKKGLGRGLSALLGNEAEDLKDLQKIKASSREIPIENITANPNQPRKYFDKNISEEQLCHINFGLAKACEDLGDFEQAFAHYSAGNVLRKKQLDYDIDQDLELFRKIKSNYPQIAKKSQNRTNC